MNERIVEAGLELGEDLDFDPGNDSSGGMVDGFEAEDNDKNDEEFVDAHPVFSRYFRPISHA
jgi:hypothetical protein